MGSLIKPGEYGIINGYVFQSVSFEGCDFNGTKIKPIEVERKLYSLGGIKIKKAFDEEFEAAIEAVYAIEMTYYGNEYEILFSLELKKGILYVRSVDHKFLEINTNEPEK